MGDYFLADDLSGALDAAAAFHHAGRRVRIVWSAEAWDLAEPGEVVGFTTETRNAPPAFAAAAVTRAIAHGEAAGSRLWYKKIDSTLRGPVAAELAALLAALPHSQVLFTPANPGVGRTVRDGILLLDGKPVAQTEFGRDPASPVRESSIRALLKEAATARVTIADAEREVDLDEAVLRLQRHGGPWVGVGSGALARSVARFGLRHSPFRPFASEPPKGPILMVGGSAHPRNREQAGTLARECSVPIIEVSVENPNEAADAALRALETRGGAALLIAAARTEPTTALHAINTAAVKVISGADVSRLFITGGETAFAICGALGIETLRFLAEVESGLGISEGSTSGLRCWLAVKPGAFGDERTWVRAWHALQRAHSN